MESDSRREMKESERWYRPKTSQLIKWPNGP